MLWMKEQQVQGGKYIIKDVLGVGGYGITYRALHTYLDTYVAIKTVNKTINPLGEPEYQKYLSGFRKEGKTLEKLSKKFHPNIVRIRDFFEEEGFPCLVMDFVEGENLMQLVQRKKLLPVQDVVYYIRQISQALVTVHDAGLIHRDVQPCNVLIQKDERAILIDFGISKSQISSTQSSLTVSGHLIYAPEEQFRDDRRPTVDIFALAGSLYYGITGEPPENCFDRRVLGKELIPPKQLVPELSEHLNQAIVRALSLDPKDRPQSMQEWVALLDNALVLNSVRAISPEVIEPINTFSEPPSFVEVSEIKAPKVVEPVNSSPEMLHRLEIFGADHQLTVLPTWIILISIIILHSIAGAYMNWLSAPFWLWAILLAMVGFGVAGLNLSYSGFVMFSGLVSGLTWTLVGAFLGSQNFIEVMPFLSLFSKEPFAALLLVVIFLFLCVIGCALTTIAFICVCVSEEALSTSLNKISAELILVLICLLGLGLPQLLLNP